MKCSIVDCFCVARHIGLCPRHYRLDLDSRKVEALLTISMPLPSAVHLGMLRLFVRRAIEHAPRDGALASLDLSEMIVTATRRRPVLKGRQGVRKPCT